MGGLFHPGGMQILLLLVVILLIFGASRLPALAKSMGQSARLFKNEVKQMKSDDTSQKNDASLQNEAAPQQATGEPTNITPPAAKPDTTQQ
ncbi:twin-arginine translocase TatA/TatE family subunit [Microbacterium nanhaiense]|nr:twin-arginine translocase TatA/TatE family subunit [Microbacterium nanhaiense]